MQPHDSPIYTLVPTGRAIKFSKLFIGNPFAYGGRMFTKTSARHAVPITYSGNWGVNVYPFDVDEDGGVWDPEVEIVNLSAPDRHRHEAGLRFGAFERAHPKMDGVSHPTARALDILFPHTRSPG